MEDVLAHAEGQIFIALPPDPSYAADVAAGAGDEAADFAVARAAFARAVPGACYLAAHRLLRGDDGARLARLTALALRCETPLVATNDVHAHAPERRALQDVLTCIRTHCTIDEAG